ncbi:MAG: hypothetical protein MUF87_16390 [Anaerolineae bacterium]|jgi:hypothetical protein|nr:hypothetical protein [Anaerolineae bacterium]
MLHNVKKYSALCLAVILVMLLGILPTLAQDGSPENPVPMGNEPFRGDLDPRTVYTWAGPAVLFGRNGNSSSGQSAIIISSLTTWKTGEAWTYLNSMTNLPWNICSQVEWFKIEDLNVGDTDLTCHSTTKANEAAKAQTIDTRSCASGVVYKLEVSSLHVTVAANRRSWSTNSYYGILGTCNGQ